MLPTFVIVGAMRAGTTSLYRYLADHPEVAFGSTKEIHFFDGRFSQGVEWYESHFEGAGDAGAVGEATPNYCYEPKAIERMAATVPDARLIMMLRDPANRAYSHYWHSRARGKETLEFDEALDAEAQRLTGDQFERSHFSYVDRGRYVPQIERILDHFPRDQLLVALFDDLKENPAELYRTVCSFLDVDASHRPSNLGEVINPFVTFRSTGARRLVRRIPGPLKRAFNPILVKKSDGYPPMTPDHRRRLVEVFEPEIEAVERFLGRGLETWRQI